MENQNLSARFSRLKKSVGGNREKYGFEHSFGMSREEQWHVTGPNRNIVRILSELEFALKLSAEENGKFDSEISSALDLLCETVKAEGVLTKSSIENAEKLIMPLSHEAKEYKLILASHAHIDMNWMWSWHETVAAALATFNTILNLMDEYPDFCYSQSQASVYSLVEKYAPEMMERIKKRIAEGRWEVTATAWVETDKNMPSTESLLHHIKDTRDYLRDHWGIDPKSLDLDFSPDTFGHSANIPELDTYGDIKYYYHCRGVDTPNALYRYRALSGAELLMYREQYWYNSAITPHVGMGIIDISKRCAGFKTGLIVYGVGDHGGGPTRRDVETALEMMNWPVFPSMKFGTIREFFKEAESVREKLPVIDHELNYIFDGCYTTQSRIKRANRYCETALADAQTLSAFSDKFIGKKRAQVKEQLEAAWHDVLFTHFHDILTGSCVQDSREYAMGLFSDAMAYANTIRTDSLRTIAESIDSSMIPYDEEPENLAFSQSEGAGVGYGIPNFSGVPSPERGNGRTRVFHIFNSLAFERTEPVEITVWDWTGDMRRIEVADEKGNPVKFAMIDGGLQQYWDHKYFRFLCDVTVPAFGYVTVVLKERALTEYPLYFGNDGGTQGYDNRFVLENENLRAEFDMTTASIKSLIDKSSGLELIKAGEFAGLVCIDTQIEGNSAWVIGRYLKVNPITKINRFSIYGHGELKKVLHFEASVKNSTISCDVTLAAHAHSLTYNLSVDWNEAHQEPTIPVLALKLPYSYECDKFLCDIPGGAVTRKAENHDIPALQYVAAVNDNGTSLSLITDSKYGYRAFDGSIIATLINTARNPDPYPERGIHDIKVSVGATCACPKFLENYASSLNRPFYYVPVNPHKGELAPSGSFISIEGKTTAVVSSVETADNGSLLVRVYEDCGKDTSVTFKFAKAVKSAKTVDLMQQITGDAKIDGNLVTFDCGAHKLNAVEIEF